MMGDWRKKLQNKQNINPVSFPPVPLLCSGESTVFWYLGRTQKQAEAFPMGGGGNPKVKRDKRTNGKGRQSGREMNMENKCVTKILKGGPGLKKW